MLFVIGISCAATNVDSQLSKQDRYLDGLMIILFCLNLLFQIYVPEPDIYFVLFSGESPRLLRVLFLWV